MAVKHLYVLLLVSLYLSTVIGENHYFQHYYSIYYTDESSPTELSATSETDIPTSESILSSTQGENETIFTLHSTFQHNREENNDPAYSIIIAIGCLAFLVVVAGCIGCFCRERCRRLRRGYIVGRIIPQQPIVTQTAEHAAVVQNIPPEYTEEPVQQFVPYYQQPLLTSPNYGTVPQGYQYSPTHPQYQYSSLQPQIHYPQGYQNASTLQVHNPPEAPPPYEPIAPK